MFYREYIFISRVKHRRREVRGDLTLVFSERVNKSMYTLKYQNIDIRRTINRYTIQTLIVREIRGVYYTESDCDPPTMVKDFYYYLYVNLGDSQFKKNSIIFIMSII